jgi:hypothetical protein
MRSTSPSPAVSQSDLYNIALRPRKQTIDKTTQGIVIAVSGSTR